MKPTIYDVAKEANVSIATVSKVLNNTGRISEKTKSKILQIMKELEYQPSSVATALTGKKTFTIGVLVPDIANPFFAEVARALENNAREMGYSIILCSTDYQLEREHDYLELLIKKQVDGIIIATEPKDLKKLRSLNDRNVPSVLFSIDHLAIDSHVVTTDDLKGGYLAGRYLIEKGHRDFVIITEPQRASGVLRVEGFKKALVDEGVDLEGVLVIEAKSKINEARKAANQILRLPKRPSAVFASTDLIAAIFINEVRKAGVSVPQDISIIGFDNTIHAEISDPGLTTIAQPIAKLASYTIEQLLDAIENPSIPPNRIMLAPTLIERESVRDLNK
ncbi:LacI family DNA-binding transcriptional regulator [Neobacillus niacini]|uniref:LacI family DNA-binding transcriptional regulator n=1 Tax=Neobacillus niacini TaxID=86668 RepID=UPI001C8DF025|nr:LacI family DNA-binding transcriptional regulator [Neobacillus niacini]MBY0145024.1 LacI family DNA-binding transcriptional regulator [Neobacillus niacini]